MSSPGFTIGDYRSYRRWHYRSYRRGAIGLSDTIGHYRSTIGVHYRTIGPGLKSLFACTDNCRDIVYYTILIILYVLIRILY